MDTNINNNLSDVVFFNQLLSNKTLNAWNQFEDRTDNETKSEDISDMNSTFNDSIEDKSLQLMSDHKLIKCSPTLQTKHNVSTKQKIIYFS